MSRLKIQSLGTDCEGIVLRGSDKHPEPDHVRIMFPGGDLEIVRATDGDKPDYWVHVRINHPDHGANVPGETMHAKLVDARLDQLGKSASESNLGDFENPNLYHVAIRVKPSWNVKP